MQITDQSFVCRLPVIRKQYDEDGNELSLVVGVCGEMVFVSYSEDTYLERDGEGGGCGKTWKVTCANGHVLLVPDHEGDDNFDAIPFDWLSAIDPLIGRSEALLS